MYFATGTVVVIVVDPTLRSISVDDLDGARTVFSGDDDAVVARYRDLRFSLRELFADLDIPE